MASNHKGSRAEYLKQFLETFRVYIKIQRCHGCCFFKMVFCGVKTTRRIQGNTKLAWEGKIEEERIFFRFLAICCFTTLAMFFAHIKRLLLVV